MTQANSACHYPSTGFYEFDVYSTNRAKFLGSGLSLAPEGHIYWLKKNVRQLTAQESYKNVFIIDFEVHKCNFTSEQQLEERLKIL